MLGFEEELRALGLCGKWSERLDIQRLADLNIHP
jgi:hypothetical protein